MPILIIKTNNFNTDWAIKILTDYQLNMFKIHECTFIRSFQKFQ